MSRRSLWIGCFLFVHGISMKFITTEHHYMTMSNVAFTTKPSRIQETKSKRGIIDHMNSIVVEKLLS